MTALSADRNTPQALGDVESYPVLAAIKCFAGGEDRPATRRRQPHKQGSVASKPFWFLQCESQGWKNARRLDRPRALQVTRPVQALPRRRKGAASSG